jgi:hypothetical protein
MYNIYKIGAKFAKRGITFPPFGGSILVPIDTICPCGSLPRFFGVSSDLTRELLPKVVGGGGADILSAPPHPFVCRCPSFHPKPSSGSVGDSGLGSGVVALDSGGAVSRYIILRGILSWGVYTDLHRLTLMMTVLYWTC